MMSPALAVKGRAGTPGPKPIQGRDDDFSLAKV
jgi:hypothetical protein